MKRILVSKAWTDPLVQPKLWEKDIPVAPPRAPFFQKDDR